MTSAEYSCKTCGGRPRDDERFDCPACGRHLGICVGCGFPVWLSAEEDVPPCEDCQAFEGASLSPEERERLRLEWARRREHASLRRELANARGRELSRIVAAAYRAAGSPRKVSASFAYDPLRIVHVFITRTGDTCRTDPATQADVDAWRAWVRQRECLRRTLGVNRGRGRVVTASDATPESDGDRG